ncbi:MAG: DegV family protein [Coriobacteriia bacterium]|nr:DegV family protein [Coriobacteriia bacterium]
MGTTARSVAIVTDSTSDLPRSLAEEHGITVVPLNVMFGSEVFQDGDLSQAEFFAKMNAAPKLPTTSQPSVGVFAEYYAKALEAASEVVAIHISEKLSGTIETARQAAEQFGGRVHVFDSRNLSGGLGLQVVAAARAAMAGARTEEVLKVAESARERVRMIVGVDKLDNLAKGGRIGAVSAFVGGLLNLKVTFTVDSEGAFQPVARTRGTSAALQHTVDWARAQLGERTRATVCIMHALSEDKAVWLREHLEAAFEVVEMQVVEVGVVIATHTGTGWGVAVVPQD